MQRPLMPITLIVILLMLSCSADPLDKLGSQGERCTSDNDCRLAFICDRGLCVDPAGVDPDPDPRPDPEPTFDPEPEPEPEPEPDFDPDPEPIVEPEPPPELIEELCKALCDHLLECGFDVGDDECVEQCAFDLQGAEESVECLLDLDCDEFDERGTRACFEDSGNNDFEPDLERCFETCAFIGSCDEFHERCGSDIVEEIVDQCFGLCEDEGARQQINAANGLPCDVVIPLAIDGFGLGDVCE